MSNRFSDTKEIPVQRDPKQRPRRPKNPQQPLRKYQRTIPAQPQQSRPQPSAEPQRQTNQPTRQIQQPARRVDQPSRQRLAPPPAYPPSSVVRRASYQDQMPAGEKSMPHRRPPQQTQYRAPEFDEYENDYEPDEPAPKRRKKKRRRRHGCLQKLLISVITLVVVLFGMYSAAALLAIKQLEQEATAPRQLTAMAAEPDPDVKNILLIGTDSRGDEIGRADTMILLSFSKHNHTVTMTSIMRDSYVSIPNYGTNKINAAYAYGGPTLVMDTIANNYGIPIDDYVCINFRAFVHIADALGGLKIEVSDSEAEAINVILQSEVNGIMGDDPMSDFLPSGGTFLLNGKQALAYARIRYIGNADFERTERQREVLDLILNKLKHPNPAAIPKILANAMPELKTNMTTGKMYLLSLTTPVKLISYDMQKLRLPADGTFSDQTAPDGQMVLAVDFDANLQLYMHAVNDPLPEADPAAAPAEVAQ